MATDKIQVAPGSGVNIASHSFGEDAITKHLQRVVTSKSDGSEITPAQEGAAITGQSLESGGSFVLGWLSSLRKAITDRLPAALTGSGNLKAAIVEAVVSLTVNQMLHDGSGWVNQRTPGVFVVVDLAAGTTETTIWDPAAGKKFVWMGGLLRLGAAGYCTFRDNTAGTIIGILDFANASPPVPFSFGNGIVSAAANNVLTVERSASATLRGMLWGQEI